MYTRCSIFLVIPQRIEFSASPLFGPEAGGTVVSIRYGFVQNEDREEFPNVEVTLGGQPIHNVIIQYVKCPH